MGSTWEHGSCCYHCIKNPVNGRRIGRTLEEGGLCRLHPKLALLWPGTSSDRSAPQHDGEVCCHPPVSPMEILGCMAARDCLSSRVEPGSRLPPSTLPPHNHRPLSCNPCHVPGPTGACFTQPGCSVVPRVPPNLPLPSTAPTTAASIGKHPLRVPVSQGQSAL